MSGVAAAQRRPCRIAYRPVPVCLDMLVRQGAGKMAIVNREPTTLSTVAENGQSERRIDLNPVFRSGILAATSNPLVSRFVQRYGMRLGASRFVAGETFDEAIPVL